MRVLLSIRPIYADSILSNLKTFEFRRRLFSRKDVSRVVIYSTKPVAKIVGEFEIQNILEASPEVLWQMTSNGSGVLKQNFDAYFKGRYRAFAIQIGGTRRYAHQYDPDEIFRDFSPPQSFTYLRNEYFKNGFRYEDLK